MKSLLAFTQKEWMEQVRSSRLMILCILFVLFGIMNPAIAKLTPWLFEMMADSLEESGMIITTVTVTAMTSWTQFFKNIPMGLIAFILMESSIFTKEYQSGTLILALTKGLERYKVLVAKTIVLLVLWSICYWMCFGITYGYNAYFWDNSIAQNLMFTVVIWWLFGIWTIFLVMLFSTIASSNTGVLVGTGAVVLGAYLVGLLPKVNKFMPTKLMETAGLLVGMEEASVYTCAIVVAMIISVGCLVVGILLFNKKKF